MHQFTTHRKTPTTFNTYFSYTMNVSSCLTRQVYNNNIFFAPFQKSTMPTLIKIHWTKIWNNIPLEIKNSSFLKFKEQYKKHIIEKYERD